jgi:hypothetical protein
MAPAVAIRTIRKGTRKAVDRIRNFHGRRKTKKQINIRGRK